MIMPVQIGGDYGDFFRTDLPADDHFGGFANFQTGDSITTK